MTQEEYDRLQKQKQDIAQHDAADRMAGNAQAPQVSFGSGVIPAADPVAANNGAAPAATFSPTAAQGINPGDYAFTASDPTKYQFGAINAAQVAAPTNITAGTLTPAQVAAVQAVQAPQASQFTANQAALIAALQGQAAGTSES